MPGRSEDQRDLLDVESVAGHLLKPGSVLALLAAHRGDRFPDELFCRPVPVGAWSPVGSGGRDGVGDRGHPTPECAAAEQCSALWLNLRVAVLKCYSLCDCSR